jgi:cytochrome P450
MFPTIWMTFRSNNQPLQLGEYHLPAETWIFIAPFLVHRDKSIWERPDDFMPERFKIPPPNGTYLPFLRGQRNCLGQHFAMWEMQMVLGMLTRRFSFQPIPGLEPAVSFKSILTPVRGIYLKIEARDSAPTEAKLAQPTHGSGYDLAQPAGD